MAHTTHKPKEKDNGKPAWNEFTFVQYTLSVSEKADFEKWWLEKSPDAFVFLEEMVASDHKFSCSWDGKNDCFIASLTCLLKRSPNYTLILTSRSDEMWEAIGLNLYKHYVIFKGEDWEVRSSQKWG